MSMRRRGLPGARIVAYLMVAGLLLGACAPAAQTPPPKAEQPAAPAAPAAKPAAPAAQPAAPAAPAAAPAGGKRTLTVAYSTDLEGWNPYGHSSSTVYARYMHIAEPLLYRDEAKNDWVPALAESWKAVEPTTWE